MDNRSGSSDADRGVNNGKAQREAGLFHYLASLEQFRAVAN
jgi:hypothetical protein